MDSRAKLEKHLNRSNAFLTNAAVNMTNKHDSFEKLEYLDNPCLNRFYSSLPDGFHHVSFKLFNFAEALQRVQSRHKCRQVTRHCIFDVTWGKELINSMHEIINLELLKSYDVIIVMNIGGDKAKHTGSFEAYLRVTVIDKQDTTQNKK